MCDVLWEECWFHHVFFYCILEFSIHLKVDSLYFSLLKSNKEQYQRWKKSTIVTNRRHHVLVQLHLWDISLILSNCCLHLSARYQAYSAALQTQWQWVNQLCVCVEQHLKDNRAYFQVRQIQIIMKTEMSKPTYTQNPHEPILSCYCQNPNKVFCLSSVYEWCSWLWVIPAPAPGNHQETVHLWQEQPTEQTGGPAAGLDGLCPPFQSRNLTLRCLCVFHYGVMQYKI